MAPKKASRTASSSMYTKYKLRDVRELHLRLKGPFPRRWTKAELIASIEAPTAPDSGTTVAADKYFEFFNPDLPQEIRDMIYSEMFEVDERTESSWQGRSVSYLHDAKHHNLNADLRSLSRTCKQIRQEVLDFLDSPSVKIRLVWFIGHNTRPEDFTHRHKYDCVIGTQIETPQAWENPNSPMVMHRKSSVETKFSRAFRYEISILMLRGRNLYRRSLQGYLNNNFSENLTIMTKLLMDLSTVSCRLGRLSLKISKDGFCQPIPLQWMQRLVDEALLTVPTGEKSTAGISEGLQVDINGKSWDRAKAMARVINRERESTVEEILARPQLKRKTQSKKSMVDEDTVEDADGVVVSASRRRKMFQTEAIAGDMDEGAIRGSNGIKIEADEGGMAKIL